jgi:hypothetical protein
MTIDTNQGTERIALLELVQAARESLESGDQEPWLVRIDDAYDRIDAGFDRACGDEDTDTALVLAASLEEYWLVRSKLSAGCDRLIRTLALGGGTPKHRADALHALGELEFARGSYDQSVSAPNVHWNSLLSWTTPSTWWTRCVRSDSTPSSGAASTGRLRSMRTHEYEVERAASRWEKHGRSVSSR